MGTASHCDHHYLFPVSVLKCAHLFIALYCIFRANPGCLGSLRSFKTRFSEPIEQGQKHSTTKRVLAEGRKAVQALAKLLCRWFLRRTKALISDQLPKKDDRVSLSVQLRYFIRSYPFIQDVCFF